MINTSDRNTFFSREHLKVIIGILFVALHIVDERVRGEELPPPFIPLVIVAVLYPIIPKTARAVLVVVGGALFFIAQIIGHIIPIIQRGFEGSDYTGVLPMIGGVILVCVGVEVFRRARA